MFEYDKSYWKVNDEAWVKKRELQWKSEIQQKFKFLKKEYPEDIGADQIRHYRLFYIRGELCKEIGVDYYLAILLWLHPSHLFEVWNNFSSSFLSWAKKVEMMYQFRFNYLFLSREREYDPNEFEFPCGVSGSLTNKLSHFFYQFLSNEQTTLDLDKDSKGATNVLKKAMESCRVMKSYLSTPDDHVNHNFNVLDIIFPLWKNKVEAGCIHDDRSTLEIFFVDIICFDPCYKRSFNGAYFSEGEFEIWKEERPRYAPRAISFSMEKHQHPKVQQLAKALLEYLNSGGGGDFIQGIWQQTNIDYPKWLADPYQFLNPQHIDVIKESHITGKMPELVPDKIWTVKDIGKEWKAVTKLYLKDVIYSTSEFDTNPDDIETIYDLLRVIQPNQIFEIGDFTELDDRYVGDKVEVITDIFDKLYEASNFVLEFEDIKVVNDDGEVNVSFKYNNEQYEWDFSEDAMVEFFEELFDWLHSLNMDELFWEEDGESATLYFLDEAVVKGMKSLGYSNTRLKGY